MVSGSCESDTPLFKWEVTWITPAPTIPLKVYFCSVSLERWCRLRGNLLFYFKSRDQWSEPAGQLYHFISRDQWSEPAGELYHFISRDQWSEPAGQLYHFKSWDLFSLTFRMQVSYIIVYPGGISSHELSGQLYHLTAF